MLFPRAAVATITTTLTLCPTTASILPAPAGTSASSPSAPLATTGITFHQGKTSSNNTAVMQGRCEAQEVSEGTLTAGFCIGLRVYAVSIARLADRECSFKMFRGSEGCEADATDSYNVPIPKGEGDVCLVTGVEDGGMFVKSSGFLVCASG